MRLLQLLCGFVQPVLLQNRDKVDLPYNPEELRRV